MITPRCEYDGRHARQGRAGRLAGEDEGERRAITSNAMGSRMCGCACATGAARVTPSEPRVERMHARPVRPLASGMHGVVRNFSMQKSRSSVEESERCDGAHLTPRRSLAPRSATHVKHRQLRNRSPPRDASDATCVIAISAFGKSLEATLRRISMDEKGVKSQK